MSKGITRSIWFPLIFAIVLAGGIFLGYNIQKGQSVYSILGNSENIGPIQEAIQLINNYYVENPELSQHADDIINKIISELDPHSYLIPAKEMQEVTDEMSGSFEGIGIEFYIVKDTIQVVSPIPGGPSEQLGVMSGDQIIKVNDTLVAGVKITNDQVIKKLKGPKGTTVKISVKRRDHDKLIDFTIKRNKIPLNSIDAGFKINDNTGYIKIGRFNGKTYSEFITKLVDLKKQNIDQLVIDLRQNPGGFLEEAVKIISEILGNKKEIVYIQGRTVPKQSYFAEQDGLFTHGKVVVLIDEGSASASEIFAGAIQDWDRGAIVGRRSFGKGLVQQQFPLSNGSAIRLTIARYYTPSGRLIQKPYIKGHGDEYNHDIIERYEDGELFKGDDNTALAKQDTSNEFFTKTLKRPVFGGGGIAPDYFVPFDTSYLTNFSMNVIANGLIQDFIYDYYNKHIDLFKKYKTIKDFNNQFQIDQNLYSTFINFCINKKHAQSKGQDNQAVKNELKLRLKASIAKQLFNSEAYSYVVIQEDDMVKKALSIMSSPSYPFK